MDNFEPGLYKVRGVPGLGAIHIDSGRGIGFVGKDDKIYRDGLFYYSPNNLPPSATLTHLRSETLEEAVSAFRENRQPRWLNKTQ